MKLMIKQRLLSWTDSYDIYDENMNKKYTAKADFLAIGHTIRFFDNYGNEVGYIKEKLLRLLSEFEVYIGGRLYGSVKRKFTLFHPEYVISYYGWNVSGNIFEWDYDVKASDGRIIAQIEKKIFNLTDTYVITINDPSDEIPLLLLVAAIDASNCEKN